VAGLRNQASSDDVYALLEAGRGDDALALSRRLVAAAPESHAMIAAHCAALKAVGRKLEALAFNQRAVELFPTSGVAWHNYAATLDDVGRHADAIDAIREAFRQGTRGAATRLVLCHAYMHLGNHADAEVGYRALLQEHPGDTIAAQELARLIWTTTGDARRATAPLQALRDAVGPEPGAVLLEARILRAAGRPEALEQLFAEALARRPDDVALLSAAANAALVDGRLEAALDLATRAVALAPNHAPALTELVAIRLAQGRSAEAWDVAERAVMASAHDLSTWAWLATAARAVGDPVAAELNDYAALVRTYRIETPPGWPSLEAYLQQLAEVLDREHSLDFEPPDQSVRGGVQTSTDLSRSQSPELQALFAALDAPIRSYLTSLGTGAGPLLRRNTFAYRIDSAWSVRLRPGGFHDNHFHAKGWISSAFYVATPDAVRSGSDRQGWLKLGEPPFPTLPPLPAEHFVQPEPGLLVLFPSYMWHGTVPFSSDESRLSVAFDVLPA
jgi:uncharacterized protein (TIGR02466 family)